jgi:hypothetical protein
MTTRVKVVMGLFYVLVTGLIAGTFAGRAESWLEWAQAITLWFVSVVMPVLWTRALVAKLEVQGVPVRPLQIYLVMPCWCAAIAAVIALR